MGVRGKTRLALEPRPPIAYKRYSLPVGEDTIGELLEPHAPPDYRYVETFFLEGLQAQGVFDQWRESPWLPRRAYWLCRPNSDPNDPEGSRPLSDEAVLFYKHMAEVWQWSQFRRNQTERNVAVHGAKRGEVG